MKAQHLSEDFCLDYLTGELPTGEKASFETHLGVCADCQLRVNQYRSILRDGLPSMADEMVDDMAADVSPWAIEGGEKKLYAAIANGARPKHDILVRPIRPRRLQTLKAWIESKHFWPNVGIASVVTVSMVLAVGLANSIYRLGVRHGTAQSRVAQVPPTDDRALRAQLESLVREREAIRSSLAERASLIAQLRVQIEQQRKRNELLEEKLQSANQQGEEQAQQISSQRDDLARKLEDQQAVLAATQKKLDTIQQTGSTDAVRVVSLENRIQQMSELLKDKDATIDERERMLASDRDIRELMGARDLYIAEVYDVGGNGKRKKPYGRVFYTKGKSLIFYGYDLDQQPGLKSANTFQAWGMRGPDRNSALNLGVMYVDNSTNKRWFLRFDDPKALEEINAVFVTVEPDGQSRVPRGKQVLFAYLKEEPNHP